MTDMKAANRRNPDPVRQRRRPADGRNRLDSRMGDEIKKPPQTSPIRAVARH